MPTVRRSRTSATLLDTSDATESDILVLDKLASGGTVVLAAAAAGANTLQTVQIKDAATGTADVLNLVAQASSADVDFGTLTAADVETVNLTASDIDMDDDNDDTSNEAVDDAVETITITLAAEKATKVDLGTSNANLSLSLTAAALTTVDGSSMTGALTLNANTTLALTVTGGSGNDVLSATGSGDKLNGGAGNDTLTGADLTVLTGGAGNDTFVINKPSNVNSYSPIADLAAGDVIDLDAGNAGTVVFTKSAITLGDTAVFQDFANAAVNALGTDTNDAAWFQFAGNTYIVQSGNNTAGNDFVNGSDSIIKIVGLVNLSSASYNQTIGTLEIV